MNKCFIIYFYLLSILFFNLSCSKQKKIDNNQNLKILNQASTPITNFDPQKTTGLASLHQLSKVYESLMETHPFDGPYKVLPNLSSGFPKVSADGLTYTFKIKKGILFHPSPCFGKNKTREVTAHDFVTTFKRIADPHLVSPHFASWSKQVAGLTEWYNKNKKMKSTDYSLPMTGIKALDNHTLKIKLKYRNNFFLNDLTSSTTAPLPIEAISYYKNNLSQVEIGTGPFILTKYIRKGRIEYKRNSTYRKKYFPSTASKKFQKYVDEYKGKQVPIIDKIVVHILNETQTQWLNFLKGKVDYLEIPKDNFSNSISPRKTLSDKLHLKGIKLGITESDSNVYYLGFNLKNSIMKNLWLRKAISYAFDHHKFNQLFFNGTAEIAHTILPPNIPGNLPPLKSLYVGKNLKMAKEAIKKAGYPDGKGLPPITFTVRSSSLGRQIGDFFTKEMAQIGIKVRLGMITWNALLQKIQRGNFMIFYLAWFVGLPTGFQFFDLIYGPNHPGSYNRVGFQNPIFDQLYRKALNSGDLKIQEETFTRMNQIALDHLPLLPLVHAKDFFVQHGWLKNYVPSEILSGVEQYFDIDLELRKKLLPKL